jgi:hypothetical protein
MSSKEKIIESKKEVVIRPTFWNPRIDPDIQTIIVDQPTFSRPR